MSVVSLKRIYIVMVPFLVVAIFWLSGLFWFVREVDRMTPPVDPPVLEAVVVLTGGSNRIRTGFRLLEDGYGQKLFISGVYKGTDVHELLRGMRGKTDEKIDCCVMLGTALNTVENARETIDWLDKEAIEGFYLVTSHYHIKRAVLEFRAVRPDIKMVLFPVQPDNIDMKVWWQNPRTRWLIPREYTKYILASLRVFVTG